nr:hypothetical protein [Tanacetum cinerariifolium]
MDLFAFIRHADPTKSDRVVQDEELNSIAEEGVQAAVADKPKGTRRKRKVSDGASGSNLTPKKLREDHGTSGDAGASSAGKSLVVLQDLLDHSSLAAKVGVTAATTVPFVTSSMTLTPKHEGDSSHHSSTNATDVEATFIVRSSIPTPPVMTVAVDATAIAGTSSASVLGTGIQPIYVPKWNVINDSALDDPEVCRSMIDQLAPLGFFSQLRGMEYDQLFADFNVGATRHSCLNAEVRLWSEHNLRKRKKFERKCARQTDLLKEKDDEIASLNAHLSLKEAEAAKTIRLRSQYEAVQDEQVKILSNRLMELDSELMGMVVYLDKEFYHRFLTIIAGQRWIISRGFRLAVMKCLQSPEYVAALGTVIGLAIDKGMQTGLVASIDHRKAGRGLAEVAAYDPSVEERYVSVVLAFHGLDFNFLSQLESQKDVGIACIMESLCLEGPSTKTPEVSRLQPAYEQLLLPVHRKEDNVVIGETSLFDSMSVVDDLVQKVNKGVPATAATTTALSVLITDADVSSIPPISVADYEVLNVKASHSPKIIFEQETLETSS